MVVVVPAMKNHWFNIMRFGIFCLLKNANISYGSSLPAAATTLPTKPIKFFFALKCVHEKTICYLRNQPESIGGAVKGAAHTHDRWQAKPRFAAQVKTSESFSKFYSAINCRFAKSNNCGYWRR